MIFILNYTIRDMNWLKFYKLIKIMEKKYYIKYAQKAWKH